MSADDGVPPPAPDYPQQQEEAQAPAWDAEAPAENGEAPPNGTVGNGDDAAADEEEEPLEDEGEEEEGEEEAGPARPKPKKTQRERPTPRARLPPASEHCLHRARRCGEVNDLREHPGPLRTG
mmetsp:Transcript_25831/g.50602  ORF Transcript_25831/g.50602 Transcript_25831/m.50602 type:complete len:123 (+) Transcript_25831:180-548(+)